VTDDDPPFVSGRSPSSTRAREERRSPPAYPDADRVAVLARLVEYEYELVEFLEVAAMEADSEEERGARQRAVDQRRQSASRLCDRLRDIGAGPPEPGDSRPQSLPIPASELKRLALEGREAALADNQRFLDEAYADARSREDVCDDLRSAGLNE